MINKNFCLIWFGKIISQLGDKFYAIALSWWILQETNSPSIMGLFLLVSVLPGILLGFFAGALTDRWKRKNILVTTDIIRGFLVLLISYMSMSELLQVWHVFVIAFCLSMAAAFFDPAVQAIIPEIVEKEDLPKANSMSQMVGGICTVAGPMLGAMGVSLIGMTWIFLLNSISYFVSAVLSLFIFVNKAYRNFDEKKYLWQDIREGIGFLKKQKNVTLVLKIIAIAHFFLGSLMVSLPFLANSLEGVGVNNLGYLEMMMGAGLIGGSLFIGTRRKAVIEEKKLVAFIMTVGVCFIVISIAKLIGANIVYAYMVELSVIGVCIAFASVFWQSLLQKYTPAHMTGRVFSISSLVGNVSLPLAYGIYGFLLNLSSVMNIMAGSGICLVGLCSYLTIKNLNRKKIMHSA